MYGLNMTFTEYSDLLEEYSPEMTTGSSLVVACSDLTRLDNQVDVCSVHEYAH